ncbi:MAG: hypothetical protein GXP37_05660 [Chloroflexi bacterium]|nr:hypothetical protein [Chloroflexota bacterium]
MRDRCLRPGLAVLLLMAIAVACAAPPVTPTPDPQPLRGAGSPILGHVWPRLSQGFSPQPDTIRWDWTLLPSAQALRELEAGQLDYAMITDAAAPQPLPQWRSLPIASDALALIAHPGLGLHSISTAQIQGILDGSLQNARQLGLAAEPIRLVIRDRDSGAYALLTRHFLPQRPITLAARVLPDDDAIATWVSTHPGAVGFASLAALDPALPPIPIDGLSPRLPDYPFRYQLLLVLPLQPTPLAQQWRDWLLSAPAQAIITATFPLTR